MLDQLDMIIYCSSNLTSSLAIAMNYRGSTNERDSMREALPFVAWCTAALAVVSQLHASKSSPLPLFHALWTLSFQTLCMSSIFQKGAFPAIETTSSKTDRTIHQSTGTLASKRQCIMAGALCVSLIACLLQANPIGFSLLTLNVIHWPLVVCRPTAHQNPNLEQRTSPTQPRRRRQRYQAFTQALDLQQKVLLRSHVGPSARIQVARAA